MKLPTKIIFFAAMIVLVLVSSVAATAAEHYNKPGNVLIADQFNNRVLEVDPQTNEIIWSFGDGSSTAGPTSVVAPNDFQRVGGLSLVAGTGAPPGSEPNCPNGCADNRVMLINERKDCVAVRASRGYRVGRGSVEYAGAKYLSAGRRHSDYRPGKSTGD